jgi:hypothetical protein
MVDVSDVKWLIVRNKNKLMMHKEKSAILEGMFEKPFTECTCPKESYGRYPETDKFIQNTNPFFCKVKFNIIP